MSARDTPSITLVQYPGVSPRATVSPPCAKVHMALRVKGLDYEVKNVSSPMEAKRFNPRGRMPALVVDGETHVDSTDILTMLDERFPEPPLEPPEPAARALVKIVEDWADEVLYFYSTYIRYCVPENFERGKELALASVPLPMRWLAPFFLRRELKRRTTAQGVALKGHDVARREISQCYRAVSDMLGEQAFLTGDVLTRADLSVAAVLDQNRVAEHTPDLAAEIDRMPGVPAWLDRVHALAGNPARG